MSIIYRIINNENNKCYVGQTRKSLEKRWYQHTKNKDRNKFANAIRKYGTDCWTLEILEEIDDINLLNEREIFWIDHFNSLENGYNSTSGGLQGTIVSDETKEKLSKANKGKESAFKGHVHSPETRAIIKEKRKSQIFSEDTLEKMSIYMINNNPFKGKTHSQETKDKISKMRKEMTGKIKHSEESKLKRSLKLKNKPRSEEDKQKMRDAWVRRKQLN